MSYQPGRSSRLIVAVSCGSAREVRQRINECIASNDQLSGVDVAGGFDFVLSAGGLDWALAPPYGIKPSIQEKSCDVELGTTGVQFAL